MSEDQSVTLGGVVRLDDVAVGLTVGGGQCLAVLREECLHLPYVLSHFGAPQGLTGEPDEVCVNSLGTHAFP